MITKSALNEIENSEKGIFCTICAKEGVAFYAYPEFHSIVCTECREVLEEKKERRLTDIKQPAAEVSP